MNWPLGKMTFGELNFLKNLLLKNWKEIPQNKIFTCLTISKCTYSMVLSTTCVTVSWLLTNQPSSNHTPSSVKQGHTVWRSQGGWCCISADMGPNPFTAVSASLWVSHAVVADSFLHLWKCGCPSPRVSAEAVTCASSLDWGPVISRKGEVVQLGARAIPALFISARESGMRGCGAPGGSRGDETQGTGSPRRRGCWTDQTADVPSLKRLLPLFSVTAIHPWRSFSPCKTAVECCEAPVNLLLLCCSWGQKSRSFSS